MTEYQWIFAVSQTLTDSNLEWFSLVRLGFLLSDLQKS